MIYLKEFFLGCKLGKTYENRIYLTILLAVFMENEWSKLMYNLLYERLLRNDALKHFTI